MLYSFTILANVEAVDSDQAESLIEEEVKSLTLKSPFSNVEYEGPYEEEIPDEDIEEDDEIEQ